MWKKRGAAVCGVVLAAGLLGATVYGTENSREKKPEDMQERITLDSAIDLDDGVKLEGLSADTAEEETQQEEAQDGGREIDEIQLQEEAAESLPNIKKVAQDVMPAIVSITNVGVEEIDFFGRSYSQDVESSGSGIIVAKSEDELLIATNNHVVEGAEDLTVCFTVDMENAGDEEQKLVPAQIKGTDSSLDLAVIAVRLEDISDEVADKIGIVQLGDSDSVEVGEWAVAIGNALGYGQSVTFGIISALDREVTVSTTNGAVTNNMIQTDAAINFGNSGGALLDMEGRLIGINSAKAAVTGVEGMGYAIPINTAKPIIEELMNQTTRSKVDKDKLGALGLIPADVSEEAKQIYNIPVGAFVYKMTDNSAAEKAGIRTGDIITKLDETTISSKNELLRRMQYYEAGETVKVTVMRAGENGYEEREIEVVLGRKSDLSSDTEGLPDVYDNGGNEEEEDDDRYSYDDRDNYSFYDFFREFGF